MLGGISVEPVVRVREAVHQRLSETGWSMLDNHPLSLPHRRVSAIPLRDGWFATLLVDDWLEDDEHETPILVAAGVLGLDHEPARRITMALTGAPRSGVVVKDPSLSVALTDAAEADAPVAQLVRFATAHLDSLSKLADVDTVIAMLHDHRVASASELTPFLDDHEGRLALPSTPARWPAEWPPATPGPDSSRGFTAFMAEQKPEILARQEAVRATRAASEGKSREQIRELLGAELDTRSVQMQPVEFEQNVEFLATEHEPFGKARLALRGFKALTDLISTGSGLLAAVSEEDEPRDEPDPAWAKTPDRAGYPMWPVTWERVAVELDTDAEPLLDELMLGNRGQFGNRNVEVWLSREGPGLIVHIGSKRIGRLDARAVEAFSGAIEAAAERDEDVRTDARLTRMTGTPLYVLDLPLYDAVTSQA
jgi:hypothetical protein